MPVASPAHLSDSPMTKGVIVLSHFKARHAARAAGLRIRYSVAGAASLPPIVVLGGISATCAVMTSRDGTPGWWDAQVGPGCGIDTRRFRVIGMDFVTGRDLDGAECRSIDTADQADALAAVLDALHVARLHAVVGASYGAMVALAFAARHPARLARLVAISGAHRAHPRATALRSIQRRIIDFAARHGAAADGVALARALAIAGYREHAEFAVRFSGPPRASVSGFRFPVEDWLEHHGRRHAARVHADDYRQLCESLDLHHVDPAQVATPATLIAADPDFIVPPAQMQELARRLSGPCSLHLLRTPYGHDAFLKEGARLARLLRAALAEGVPA